MILDKAGQKGTGKWTTRAALAFGVPVPSIAASVDARVLSSMKSERVAAAQVLTGPAPSGAGGEAFVTEVHDGLLASKVMAYAQGMHLIATASGEFGWDVNLRECARIWKGGCIIRAALLDDIMNAFGDASLSNLLMAPVFQETLRGALPGLREVIAAGARAGIPLPAFGASLGYFDAYRTARLPQNLVQAQRDAFGSHTYQRIDDPDGPFIHTDWLK